MNLELKNIKHTAWASEETNCYQASLYLDGKPLATVSNDGKGGADDHYQHSAFKKENFRKSFFDMMTEIDDYFKGLPKKKYHHEYSAFKVDAPRNGAKSYEYELEMDLEIWCGEQLEKWQFAKDMKKIMRTKHLCKDEKGFFTCPHEVKVARIIRDNPKTIILNDLPFDEALTLYMGEA